MTRKDYALIAMALEQASHSCRAGMSETARAERTIHRETAIAIADALEADNPQFDRGLFLCASNA